jgi:hypothetical protein
MIPLGSDWDSIWKKEVPRRQSDAMVAWLWTSFCRQPILLTFIFGKPPTYFLHRYVLILMRPVCEYETGALGNIIRRNVPILRSHFECTYM